eukprot:10104487-Alexandrium_andersonii.AAC.1
MCIRDRGSARWHRDVDRLVQEIDSDPDRKHRKLIFFGHIRGATPAMTVAALSLIHISEPTRLALI